MDLNDYQRKAVSTAVFPQGEDTPTGITTGIMYCALKLCGESGEHAEKVGKFIRGDHEGREVNYILAKKREVVQELGDVLWYVANLADMYGYTLSEIAEMNIVKLKDRQERGVLKGSGDDR